MRASTALGPITLLLLGIACADAPSSRPALTGESPLVGVMSDVAAELDVPAEIIAGVAWTETALRDRSRTWTADRDPDRHVPRSAGVMGLPEEGRVRSIARAMALTGASEEELVFDARANVRGAAAILRELADRMYGEGALGAGGDRDRWLEVVERYFDAGATGAKLALEVRRTIARGLATTDDAGKSFVIRSFAELTELQLPSKIGTRTQAVAGEYPNSTWVAASSSNYTNASRTAADIDIVVIHTTQGSYSGTISWFQNSAAQVSAHYVVRASDGDVTQMVHHADIAWHAGNWSYNTRSIGIEHEGFVDDPNWATPALMQSSADLTRWLCDNLGIPKDRSHIIGHVEVPSATHTDPGQYWDWMGYMAMVTNGTSGGGGSNGTLKGVVYVAGDNTNRISGATVRVSPGGASMTVPSNGYFEFALPAGDYTITASAQGYVDNSVMRTVTAGQEVWGSVALTAGQAEGIYRGVVYDARGADLSMRLTGARVRLSDGQELTTGSDGAFIFHVAPGSYTATAELMGWQTNSTMRTIVSGMTEWGSIGLLPIEVANAAPATPVEASPIGGVSVVSVTPTFTVTGISDPEGDAVTLEAELYADQMLTAKVSAVTVAVPASTAIASWKHPAQDLPRGIQIFWRTRAVDTAGHASGWSTIESFLMPDDGSPSTGSMTPWTATILPGVGSDAPPTAASIVAPAAEEVVKGLHPEIAVGGATDPDGDALSYEIQISTDDVFEVVVAQSGLVAAAGDPTKWSVGQSLVAGTRYYVRTRAADARVFGPWSASVTFSVDPKATEAGEVTATIATDEGGCTAVGRPEGWLPLALVALGLFVRRRK